MSITLISEPNAICPGHNDQHVVLDSSETAQDNFKYTCVIEIGATVVATLKNRPDPVSDYGVFNVKNIIQNYLDSNYFASVETTTPLELEPYVQFVIKGGESYSVSGVTTSLTSYTSSGKTAYNTALRYTEFAKKRDTFRQTYFNKWLTDRSRTEYISIDEGENFYMMFFIDPVDTPADSYVYTYYDQVNCTGTDLGDDTVNVTGTKAYLCNLGTMPLSYPAGTLSYKVELMADGDVVDTLKFNIDACTMFTTIPLVFLNRLGGYETVYFRLISRDKVEVERKTMQQVGYEVVSGVPQYIDTNNVFYPNINAFASNNKEKKTVTSETLTDAEYRWLVDLIASVNVYEEQDDDGDIYYVPVIVTENQYEKKKRINDKLSQLVLDLDYGHLNNSQLR